MQASIQPPARMTAAEYGGMLLLSVLVLSGYVKTLYPSVPGGDSGELVAESCHLGVSHPPGYPLYNMVVYLVITYLPFGRTYAWKANFFSAVCDTIAVMLMYSTILLWTKTAGFRGRPVAAFTAAALYAFSPLVWMYAVGAEVFALNNLFTTLLIYILFCYATSHHLSTACAGAFVCGLAMCNQHTIILLEIPIILWVLWTRRYTIWWNEVGLFTAAFLLGLLPYIYMPITAIWNSQPGSWGDVTTLSGFFHHIRRGDYGTFRLFSGTEGSEGLWTRLSMYAMDLCTREIPYSLAIPVIVLGIWTSIRKCDLSSMIETKSHQHNDSKMNVAEVIYGRSIGYLVIALYVFYMVVFHSLANIPLREGLTYGVQMRFWQQPNVIVFIWFGVGLNYLLDLAIKLIQPEEADSSIIQKGVVYLVHAICTGLIAVQIITWYELCDQSRAWYIRNYAQALLDPLPRNAILFVNFDLQWTSLRYLQRCEDRRPDVTLLHLSMITYHWFTSKHKHYPNVSFPGSRLVPYGSMSDGFTMASFLDANYESTKKRGRRRIFLGGKLNYNDQDFLDKYTLTPYGLLDEFHQLSDEELSLKKWYKAQQKVKKMVHERLMTLPPDHLYNDETWEWTIARDYGMKSLSWSTYLLEKTIAEDPHNLTLLSESTHAMEVSYQFEPPQFWSAVSNLKNLGLAYAQIVKAKQEFDTKSDPFLNDIVGATVQDKTKYKDRASTRMLEVWNAWIQLPDAKLDPGFAPIESIVRKFVIEPIAQSSATTVAKEKIDKGAFVDVGEDAKLAAKESRITESGTKKTKKKKKSKKKKKNIPAGLRLGKIAAFG